MSISQNIINRMKNKLLGVCFGLFPLIIYANDSTGYVSTGGIQYIKIRILRWKVRICIKVETKFLQLT